MSQWGFFCSWYIDCAEALWGSVLNLPFSTQGRSLVSMQGEWEEDGRYVCVCLLSLGGKQRSRSSSCPAWVCQPSTGRDGHCRCACTSGQQEGGRKEPVVPVCVSCVCFCTALLGMHTPAHLMMDLGMQSCCSLAACGPLDLAAGAFSGSWWQWEQTHRWEGRVQSPTSGTQKSLRAV